MQLSKEQIQEMKDLLEEKGKKVTWEEATEAAYNLTGLAELLYDHAKIEYQREQRLKKEPKGFHLKGEGYTCFICSDSISNEETWYDRFGIKCVVCQKAIDKKVIPATTAKNKESWYSAYDLKDRFNLDRHAVNRFIKHDILKPRTVLNSAGKTHVHIFLIKDNKEVLPPKKLTEPHMVAEEKDGKTWHHLEPWYRFVDPVKHLEGYRIMDYLVFTKDVKK